MKFEAEQLLRQELGAGERLLWSGQPRQGLLLRGQDVFRIPFSLLWCGFAVFWEYGVTHGQKPAPFFFELWGIPFVVVGLYMVVGRFFADSYLRSRTCYGLTNQRVIILRKMGSLAVTSMALTDLPEISLKEKGDRSGNVVFGGGDPRYAQWDGIPWPGAAGKLTRQFELIENARLVQEQVREAQRKARGGGV